MNINRPSRPPPGYRGPKPATVRNLNDRLGEHDLVLIPTTATWVSSRKKSSGTPHSDHSLYSRNNSVSSIGSQATPGVIEYQITSRSATLGKAEIELRLDCAAGVDKAWQAKVASGDAGSFESEIIEVAMENEDEDEDVDHSDTEEDEEDDEQDAVMGDSQEAVVVDSQENGSSFHPSFVVDGAGEEGKPIRDIAKACGGGGSAGAMRSVSLETGTTDSLDNSRLVKKVVRKYNPDDDLNDPLRDRDDDSEGTKRKKWRLRDERRLRRAAVRRRVLAYQRSALS